jgi:hypothetical protein
MRHQESAVELYWLPLGAGGHFVVHNGRLFEAISARRARRPMCDLYHSALRVITPETVFVIEMAPVVGAPAADRGVVAVGPVGMRWAGRLRLFRYEVRRWASGFIPDAEVAVDSPRVLTGDAVTARRLLDLVPRVPTPVWGRDELRTGDMWNSNSLISWLIVRGGLDLAAAGMPKGGRAPGWDAGAVIARRQGT